MQNQTSSEAWYTLMGAENDCVLSTKLQFSRNISSFNFPNKIKSSDAQRIYSILVDFFNNFLPQDKYQTIKLSDFDSQARSILIERGIITSSFGNETWKGAIVKNDGSVSININFDNHLNLIGFNAGYSIQAIYSQLAPIDTYIHKHIEFAHFPKLGYVSQDVRQAGTGMQISCLVSLQGVCQKGLLDRLVKDLLQNNFLLTGYFSSSGTDSVGFLYIITSNFSIQGDTASQIHIFDETLQRIIELERKSRIDLLKNNRLQMENSVFRAISLAKYSRFIDFEEAIEIIETLRLGLSLKLIVGILNSDLTSLLYRVQPGHLNFVISTKSSIIEDEIHSDELKLDRLRTMVIQEVLKNADIKEI